MTIQVAWDLAFRVGPSQDKDARYAEVLAGDPPPEGFEADVQAAHDFVWNNFATNGEPAKPYAVYLNGYVDTDTGAHSWTTKVDTNA
jgi:hypothetical protein